MKRTQCQGFYSIFRKNEVDRKRAIKIMKKNRNCARRHFSFLVSSGRKIKRAWSTYRIKDGLKLNKYARSFHSSRRASPIQNECAIRQKYRGRQTSFSFDSFGTSEGKVKLFLDPVVKLRTSLYWTSILRASVQSLWNELKRVDDKRTRKVNKNIRKNPLFLKKKNQAFCIIFNLKIKSNLKCISNIQCM